MLILSFPSYTENVIRHSATAVERPIVSVGPTAADLVVLLRRAQAELPVEAEPTIDLGEEIIDSSDSSDDDSSNIYSMEDEMDKIVQSPVGDNSEEDELKLTDSESESDRSVEQDPDGVRFCAEEAVGALQRRLLFWLGKRGFAEVDQSRIEGAFNLLRSKIAQCDWDSGAYEHEFDWILRGRADSCVRNSSFMDLPANVRAQRGFKRSVGEDDQGNDQGETRASKRPAFSGDKWR